MDTQLDKWITNGIVCDYVKFRDPVPRFEGQEPVYEFKLLATTQKYVVNSIIYTQHGLVWRAGDEINIVPLSNVNFVRPVWMNQKSDNVK